jgi:GGDEF domain-containing protein
LQILDTLPVMSDITGLLDQVHKNPGKIFHLPWVVEAKELLYDLACGVTPGQMDPEWTLSAGSVMGALATNTIWSHSSPDMDLILNLCLMECEVPSTSAKDKDAQTSLSELKALVSEDIAKQRKDSYAPSGAQPPAYPRPANPGNPTASLGSGAQPTLAPMPGAPMPGTSNLNNMPGQPTSFTSPAGSAPNSLANIPQPTATGWASPPLPMGSPLTSSSSLPPAQTPSPNLPAGQPGVNSADFPPGYPEPAAQSAAPASFSAPAPPAPPAPPVPLAPSREDSMVGRLIETPPNSLLQSIALGLMTGLLRVREQNTNLDLWFEQGALVHATSREGEGEVAVLELLLLTQGDFEFFPNDRTPERSINRRIDAIVLECMTLVHNYQYLQKAGLTVNSYLIRRNLSLTETEFDNQTRNVHCPNREMLKTLYQQIDQHSTFLEMQRKYPSSKLDWLPALYTLVTANLVEISDRPQQDGKPVDLASVGVDIRGVQSAYETILRPDTGIMSYHLLLYFLEQEYYRYERSRLPFTFMVFSIAKNTVYGLQPLDERESRNLAQVIEHVKRKIDVLGHFQGQDFAMILPSTGIAGAKIFANRVMEIVSRGTVCDTAPENIVFACGLASLPEDGMKVEMLLPAAIEAKTNARETARGVVTFNSLRKLPG